MSNFTNKFAAALYTFRLPLFLTAIVLTIILSFQALKIKFNFSPDSIFLKDDLAFQFYQNEYLPAFGQSGQWLMLAVSSKNTFNEAESAIKEISQKLKNNIFVEQVIDAHSQTIYIPIPTGIKAFPSTNNDGFLSEAAIKYFDKHPLFEGSFIGKNSRAIALTFLIKAGFNDQEAQDQALLNVKKDIANVKQAFPNINVYTTGLPVIQHEMIDLLQKDQMLFLPLVALFLIILLLAMTKHFLGAIYPITIVLLAIGWSLGFLSLMGHDINVVNNSLMMLIMVIGIADAVHIYTRFIDESINAQKTKKNPERKQVVIETLTAMLVPCFLTSATTSLGFLSSTLAGIEIIEQFGIDTAISIIFCYIITFMMMPALLSWHKLPTKHSPRFMRHWPRFLTIDGILRFSISKSLRHAKLLGAGSVLLLIGSIAVGSQIKANQTWVGELPDDHEASLSLKFFEENFSPAMPFYLVFSGEPQVLQKYSTAIAMSDLSEKIRAHSLNPSLRSPTDAINFLLENNPQPLKLNEIDEDTFNELQSALTRFSKDEAHEFSDMFFSKDGKHVRIIGFLPNASTTVAEEFRLHLNQLAEQIKLPGLRINATGSALISCRAMDNLTRGMAQSIGLALILISVFVALFFASFRYMLIAVFPNILPIGLTVAAMHIFNIDVRLATVMIFSMALGLAIDACIHLLSRMREEKHRVDGEKNPLLFMRAIFRAFHGSGRAIIYTTFILLGGFSIMFFSGFMALRDFSIIAAATLLSALIADIVLLPALIILSRKKS